ncbi:hypothetical protein N1614_04220 [Adlercreutzia muris]|uniref:hypothetical protein n=1 Tax=Adlercreutzia muris TaxID=1796610 RepID=UPI0021D56B76|nr:hypothetical protein [Adlercreutzia muris]MCU7584553.1 hypothetical protein [Adlercreutzia muris]
MSPEKVAEAMEVMAEAQREEPPEGERPSSCDVVVGRVGGDDQSLTVTRCGSRVVDALTDHGFYLRVYGGAVRVEWREGECRAL